jgi:hypothetical protein
MTVALFAGGCMAVVIGLIARDTGNKNSLPGLAKLGVRLVGVGALALVVWVLLASNS